MTDKKTTKLICTFKNETIREQNIFVEDKMLSMMSDIFGIDTINKHFYSPKVKAYTGKEFFSKFGKAFFYTEEELARKIGGDTMDAEKFDEIMREELPKKMPTTITTPSIFGDVGDMFKRSYRKSKRGRWIRKKAIQMSDAESFVETKKSKIRRRHKAWIGNGGVKAWNEECRSNSGIPSTEKGKVKRKAPELKPKE